MVSIFPISVIEQNNVITIKNFRFYKFSLDVKKIYGTERLFLNLFKHVSGNSAKLDSFFALELLHVLMELRFNKRRTRIDLKSVVKLQEQLQQNTWLRTLEKDYSSILNYSKLSLFKFKPLDHQSGFFKFYDNTVQKYNLRGMPLTAAPGSGKTAASLMLAEMVGAEKIVVIAPLPSVDRVWYNSCGWVNKDLIYNQPQPIWIAKHGKPYKNERILVFHYETLDKAIDMCRDLITDNTFVILDESHNLNEVTSLRTIRFGELCGAIQPKHSILMSGTIFKAEMKEAIPYLRVIDPLFTEKVEVKFKKVFAGNVSKTTEILNRRLNAISYKVAKTDLNLDKPIEEIISVKVPNSNKYLLKTIVFEMTEYARFRIKELYDIRRSRLPEYWDFVESVINHRLDKLPFGQQKALKEAYKSYRICVDEIFHHHERGTLQAAKDLMPAATRFEKQDISPFINGKDNRAWFLDTKSIIKYPKLKVRGECLGRILGRVRIDAFNAMAGMIPYEEIIQSTEKKTVIFSSYVETLDTCADILSDIGYEYIGVYGNSTSNLTEAVSKFEKNESVNPLIATYASLSTAVPLVMADTMILINPPFRDYVLQQTIARIHRIGADTQIRVFHFTMDTDKEPNIASRNLDILKWSREQVAQILDISESTEITDEESIAVEELATEEIASELTTKPLVVSKPKPSYLNW